MLEPFHHRHCQRNPLCYLSEQRRTTLLPGGLRSLLTDLSPGVSGSRSDTLRTLSTTTGNGFPPLRRPHVRRKYAAPEVRYFPAAIVPHFSAALKLCFMTYDKRPGTTPAAPLPLRPTPLFCVVSGCGRIGRISHTMATLETGQDPPYEASEHHRENIATS